MKRERLFFEDWVVQDYLRNQTDRNYAKNVELLTALVLNKFCERQFSKKCWIGLEIKEKYVGGIPLSGLRDLEEISEMIRKMVEEKTPVDITIAMKPAIGKKTSKGIDFQVKRFGKQEDKSTFGLIDFLNGLKDEYASSQVSLVVLMETPEEIDLQELQNSLKTENYPFQKIILIGTLAEKINFYGIWPETGWSRYDPIKNEFDF